MRSLSIVLSIFCVIVLFGCVSNTPKPTSIPEPTSAPAQILFDDFSYSTADEMTANGWILRSGQGWPGVTGASFRAENVSFINYPAEAGNRLLRMTSSTDGTGENTYQTQICHQRKYMEGTYAARVRFSDLPVLGSDGDQIVQSFYMITPYEKAFDPDYSEMDFEYLANGGWSESTSMHFTTWETVQIEPWNADNASNATEGSLAGWHTLLAQVTDGTVRYFVDGKMIAQHGGDYYPDAPMSINFNLWFIDGGLNGTSDVREYQEDIDWVFHEADVLLMPDEVDTKINELRNVSVGFQDSVSPGAIALDSPCDL
jgi:hypothetical protein